MVQYSLRMIKGAAVLCCCWAGTVAAAWTTPPSSSTSSIHRATTRHTKNFVRRDGFSSTRRNALPDIQGTVEAAQQAASQQVSSVLSQLETVTERLGLPEQQAQLQAQADLILQTVRENVASNPALSQLWDKVAEAPASVNLIVSAGLTYAVVSSLLGLTTKNSNSRNNSNRPYPLNAYDADAARAYFDARPIQAVGRATQIALLTSSFLLPLLQDKLRNELELKEEERAMELATLLTKLGPSFIKIGQSLSIRTDLLRPAYVRGLKSLQDQVPPFDSKEAKLLIEEELGRPVNDIFMDLSDEPVAAASLGQVYRARLKDANQTEVAIKVQRPNIMEQIALDMYLIREIAPVLKRTFNLNTDLAGTVDAWGTGFVDELDYLSEAANAKSFIASIAKTPLGSVVFAPPVIDECTTDKILTTKWVDGERLDKSAKDDVTILCSICMNTYLTMMLETGVLHCDPHPGNLLRTTDGKLCILDWGMVTRLDPDLQVTLIEHMAHLTSADYEEIPRDLLLLGFIPPEKAGLIKDSGVVEVLADIYGAWTKGGGAATINVNKVISQLQDLTATRGNLFQIPPYFAYIAKSFSVLEGIGLCNDENYSIINECLPYVSKRLLTDKSDRTGGALSTFIFGPEKSNTETRLVDYDRVEQLVTGFGDYTTSASGALLGSMDKNRAQLIEEATDQILDLLVTDEETPLQTIFIEQLAKIITSSSRSVWTQLRESSGTLPSGRSVLGTIVDPLGLFRTSPVVRMNDMDMRTVDTTRNLITLAQQQISTSKNPAYDLSTLSNQEVIEVSSILVRKLWERRSGVVLTGSRLFSQLLKMTADKLERGERDVPLLSDTIRSVEEPAETATEAKESSSSTRANTNVSSTNSSNRLDNARQLLAELEQDHDVYLGVDVIEKQSENPNAEGTIPALKETS